MLNKLLNHKKIQVVSKVDTWEDAIALASDPLVEDGSIKRMFINEMIENIKKFGPYIVIADYFALPHASSSTNVNRLSMSLLIVEEPVDLLGKPVNVFLVLATTDNSSHMKALASLSEILYVKENIEVFRSGNKDSIMELINSTGEEVTK